MEDVRWSRYQGRYSGGRSLSWHCQQLALVSSLEEISELQTVGEYSSEILYVLSNCLELTDFFV